MNENSAWRVPAWRTFMWAGVVASVAAWALAWVVDRGAQVFMVIVALAAVAFAYRATTGMRLALVGLILAGFVMFLASLYLPATQYLRAISSPAVSCPSPRRSRSCATGYMTST